MISVAAFNAAGDGPRSLPTRGRTQQAGKVNPDVHREITRVAQKTSDICFVAYAFTNTM